MEVGVLENFKYAVGGPLKEIARKYPYGDALMNIRLAVLRKVMGPLPNQICNSWTEN
jgi:hypothetical protein